jgi:hypothetical protein
VLDPSYKSRERTPSPADNGTYTDDATPEELEEMEHSERVYLARNFAAYTGNDQPMGPLEFTCSGCGLAPKCMYAFDGYNLDGDCLLDK